MRLLRAEQVVEQTPRGKGKAHKSVSASNKGVAPVATFALALGAAGGADLDCCRMVKGVQLHNEVRS